MEVKYHRDCYRRYTATAHLSVDKSIRADYDSAFLKLIDEIEQKLVKEGRAYDNNGRTLYYSNEPKSDRKQLSSVTC